MDKRIHDASMLRVGATLQMGKYRIERYLSSGGFGNTYVAFNTEFEETVAIKEFFMRGITERDANNSTVSVSNKDNLSQFDEQLKKFKKEARRIRQLHNEHIVAVHDLFEENGTAYYVMDYVDGESLRERLKRLGRPLDEQEVRDYLPQILDALRAIHAQNIWHLDLKPGNIMVDRQGQVRVIDFGASKQMRSGGAATTLTATAYTQGYAPREQMEQSAAKYGPWTDLYALGATIYNLLTRRTPPMPSDIDDHGDRAFDDLCGVSPEMKELVRWLMASNRQQRPQSVDEVSTWMARQVPSTPDVTIIKQVNETPRPSKKEGKGRAKAGVLTPLPELPKGKLPAEGPQGESSRKRALKTVAAIAAVIAIFIGYIAIFIGYDTYMLMNQTQSQMTYDTIAAEEAAEEILASVDSNFCNDSDIPQVIRNLMANMVHVEGGTFTMGVTNEQVNDAWEGEMPAHKVTLSSFSIGKYEVTQAEWQAVMGSNPSGFTGDSRRPVELVSWDDCQEFIRKLNAMTGKQFRLPTSAEWEYAARGGNRSRGYKYAGSNTLGNVAWYDDNSGPTTHPVGTKSPNELGLYDMSGNVWEWCQDWYGEYSSSSQNNPTGPSSGSERVSRGGSWHFGAWYCRVSYNTGFSPDDLGRDVGLRLAL